MKITLFPRNTCLTIAQKDYPHIKSQDELLDYLPDAVFGKTFTVEYTEEIFNHTSYTIAYNGSTFVVSEEFVRCIDDVVVKSDFSKAIEPNDIVFNNVSGWLLKFDSNGIVTVNPELINQQPDEIAKQVLECLDNSILPSFKE